MKKLMVGLLAIVSALGLLTLALPVHAADVVGGACGVPGASGSSICSSTGATNPVSGSGGVLMQAINLIAIGGGIAAVIVIIVAGVRFITSNGDPNNVTAARNTILYAVIGLVVIVVSRSIVVFVINYINK